MTSMIVHVCLCIEVWKPCIACHGRFIYDHYPKPGLATLSREQQVGRADKSIIRVMLYA
jgi:hypothetical protein